jgi:hypothetical protein
LFASRNVTSSDMDGANFNSGELVVGVATITVCFFSLPDNLWSCQYERDGRPSVLQTHLQDGMNGLVGWQRPNIAVFE